VAVERLIEKRRIAESFDRVKRSQKKVRHRRREAPRSLTSFREEPKMPRRIVFEMLHPFIKSTGYIR